MDYHWIELTLEPSANPNLIATPINPHITLGFFSDAESTGRVWDCIFKILTNGLCGGVLLEEFVRVGPEKELLALKVQSTWVMHLRALLEDALALAGLENSLDRTYDFMPHLTLGRLDALPDRVLNLGRHHQYNVQSLQHIAKGGKVLRTHKFICA